MKMQMVFALLLLLTQCTNKYIPSDISINEDDQTHPVKNELPVVSFRIIFGLNDSIPQPWNGQVIVAPGQEIEIEADRFRDHQYTAKGWSPQGIITIKLGDPVLPNDYVSSKNSWVCSTRESPMHGPTTEWHDHGQINNLHHHEVLKPVIQQPSILIHQFSNSPGQPVRISTVNGEFSFIPKDINAQQKIFFLQNRVSVEMVPPVQLVADRSGQQDFPSVLSTRAGELWILWQEHKDKNDKIIIRSRIQDKWGPATVLAEKTDAFQTALCEDAKNRVWAVWSMQIDGNWDLYGRCLDENGWSRQIKLTDEKTANNIYHKMVAASDGRMWLIWQSIVNGLSQIYARNFDGSEWSEAHQISIGKSSSGNNWWPSVAAGPAGNIAVAWDGYAGGSYDVYLRVFQANTWQDPILVSGTARFEAHPSVTIDKNNKIWIAWDESGIHWGQNTGFLVDINKKGTQLHESRTIGIACLDSSRLLTTQKGLNEVLDRKQFWELPHLQLDAKGRPWLFVRHLVMREPDTPLEGPIDLAMWEIMAVRFDGLNWTKPVYLPRSTGRNDMMPASALDADGNIWAVWATDQRDAKTFQSQQLQIQLGKIIETGIKESLAMKPYEPGASRHFSPFDPYEIEQVKKIRDYRIQHNGKTYSIFRGDLHRHTDISVDGNNDGSLLDAYRYARDVAKLDFIGVADHTDAIWDSYNWWHNQKTADLFQDKNSFVAFYGYERSVEYPNGHRNIFFIKRDAADVLPIGSFEARGYVGTGKLYAYLRSNNGFSIPHTTGRTSGTDWRDNDPIVESLLELYQGSRDSYEYPGSPRPFKLFALPDSTLPIPRASSAPNSPSFRPLGFANSALEKGYKLGFIASSDHISTHISYACLIAEDLTLESLLDAVRKRRSYAATDNIILDIRHQASGGEYLMGDIFESTMALKIKANIIGTGDIKQVDIIKNGRILHSYQPNQAVFKFEYTDTGFTQQKTYYYVRVIQSDGEMAWGSPVWVTYKK